MTSAPAQFDKATDDLIHPRLFSFQILRRPLIPVLLAQHVVQNGPHATNPGSHHLTEVGFVLCLAGAAGLDDPASFAPNAVIDRNQIIKRGVNPLDSGVKGKHRFTSAPERRSVCRSTRRRRPWQVTPDGCAPYSPDDLRSSGCWWMRNVRSRPTDRGSSPDT